MEQGAIISGREIVEPLDEPQSGTHAMTPVPLTWVHRYPWSDEHPEIPRRTSTDNAHLSSHKNLGRQDVPKDKIDRAPVFISGSPPYEEVVICRRTTESVAGGLMRISCAETPMRLKARLTPVDCFNRISKKISKQGGVSGYNLSVKSL